MKKLLIIINFIVLTHCSVQQKNQNSQNKENFIFNQDPTMQAQYQKEWNENIKNITKNTYFGEVDVWGDGALKMYLWFQDGNLWDSMITIDNIPYVLHCLLTSDKIRPSKLKATFLDGKTAIMYMPNSASYKLASNLYLVRVSNNTIYRTANARKGFAHLKTWDKKTIPPHSLVVIATNINP